MVRTQIGTIQIYLNRNNLSTPLEDLFLQHANDNNLAEDLLKGADAIAEYLGMDRRAVYFAVSKSRLPTFRIGTGVFARKSTLLDWISRQENIAA